MNLTVAEYPSEWTEVPAYPWKEKAQKEVPPKPTYQETALKTYQEFSPAVLAVIITKLVHKIFGFAYLEALFVSSTAFFLTLVVRNLCKEYTFFAKCEEIALEITRKFPYIHVVVGIIAAVSITHFPVFSIPLAAGVGILTALTYRVRWLSAASEAHQGY